MHLHNNKIIHITLCKKTLLIVSKYLLYIKIGGLQTLTRKMGVRIFGYSIKNAPQIRVPQTYRKRNRKGSFLLETSQNCFLSQTSIINKLLKAQPCTLRTSPSSKEKTVKTGSHKGLLEKTVIF